MNDFSNRRYGAIAKAFHWTTATLVLIAFWYGPGGPELRVYSPALDGDRRLHETLGLCIFALAITRILWRTVDTRPDPPEVTRWMGLVAKYMQGALYLLLLALPLTAITGAWLEGHPLTLLAGANIPPLLGISHHIGAAVARIHTWLGDSILWLAGFHAIAALYHHIFLKDHVLTSMLPRWIPLQRPKDR